MQEPSEGLWLSCAQQLPRWPATGARTPRAETRAGPGPLHTVGPCAADTGSPPEEGPWPRAHSPHTVSPTPGPGQAPSVSPRPTCHIRNRQCTSAQVKWLNVTGLLPESPGAVGAKSGLLPGARQGSGGLATASAAESRAGLAPQTARQRWGSSVFRSGHSWDTQDQLFPALSPRSSGRGTLTLPHPMPGATLILPRVDVREKLLRPRVPRPPR